MARRNSGDIPLSLARGRDRFEQWRRGRNVGARIPGKLWTLAVRLAEAYGVSRTAATLKLDYNSLRIRVEAKNEEVTSLPATFIEVAAPEPTTVRECVIELDDGQGATLRVRLRGGGTPDLVALCRSFRSGQ